MIQVEVTKNLAALEDLLFGVGTTTQQRGGQSVEVTKINAANLPFDATRSLQERIDEMDDQYAYMMQNRELLMAAVNVITLLNALQVNIDELAAWLANGHQVSAFIPMVKSVTHDEYLGDNLNYFMLEETEIGEDVTIHMGVDTHLYVLKGEEFVP